MPPIHHIDNPHAEFFPYGRLAYWRDGGACGKHDEWTYVMLVGRGISQTEMRFTHSERSELASFLALLSQAYESGMREKARQIREMLLIPEER